MDRKVEGAWIIHHTNKLQTVTNQNDFENTFVAGKAGILLSAISSEDQLSIKTERLEALAKASGIGVRLELPVILPILEDRKLIERGTGGIEVLGVTSAATLQHASDIFNDSNPSASESAAIFLAERASEVPIDAKEIKEEISDSYKLKSSSTDYLLSSCEKIGFIDVEDVDGSKKLYFNGNLFRRESLPKTDKILGSLNSAEQIKLIEVTDLLKSRACISVDEAKKIMGEGLFSKVSAIGIFDINVVSNANEETGFLTLPSAFSKYSTSMVDDAFDLTKAFVSSLTYGMTKSQYERGQITMIAELLQALINGRWIGPATAIGQDYKVLELKGVVQVQQRTGRNGRSGPMMKLLKKEVGELALKAIQDGDVSEQSLQSLPTATVTHFSGPEINREKVRRRQVATSPKATRDLLTALRTGQV